MTQGQRAPWRSAETSWVEKWRRRSPGMGMSGASWLIAVCLLLQILPCLFQPSFAAEPYQVRFADPLLQPWRITRFPELADRGLRCMAEDHAGNMWFGVDDGAVCYDGLNWTTYGAAEGLVGGGVDSIAASSDGSMVAATQQGIFRFQANRWNRIFPAIEMPFLVHNLRETSGQVLWACSPWGLLRLQDGESTLFTSASYQTVADRLGIFHSIVALPTGCCSLERFGKGTGIVMDGQIVSLLSEQSPAKAAGLRIGDKVLDVQGGATNSLVNKDQLANQQIVINVERFDSGLRETVTFTTTDFEGRYRTPSIYSLTEDSLGQIWVGASKGRLFMTQDGGSNWQTWAKSEGLVVGKRPTIMETSDGQILVTSSERDSGLCRFDGSTWTHENLSRMDAGDFTSAAAETIDGTVWIAAQFRLQLWRHGDWSMHDTRDLNFPGESHLLLVASDDSLWIAGRGKYPVRIAMSANEFLSVEGLTYQCSEESGTQWFIENDSQRVIRYDGSEAISFGAQDGTVDAPIAIVALPGLGVVAWGNHDDVASISTFDGSDWHRVDFPDLSRELSRKGHAVTSDGRVWISIKGNRHSSDKGGMIVGRVDDWQHLTPPLAPTHASAIIELPDGRMLFAGAYGVMTYDGTTLSQMTNDLLRDVRCDAGVIDSASAVWLATQQHGILRYQDNTWTAFTTDDGLLANEVATIAAGAHGQIWASTTEGLCRFDGTRFQSVSLPRNFGRKSLNAGQGHSVWFDGSHRYVPELDPPIAVLDEQSMELEMGSSVVVNWHGTDAWNRTAADALSWSYRIDDGPWSAFRRQSQLVLKDLPQGKHTLQVQSRDDDFNVSQPSRVLPVLVLPPLWMRPWFLASVAALLAVLIWQSTSLIRRGVAIRVTNSQLETARSQLADQFAEKSAQFRAICDCSPIGIFVTDTAGKVTYFNQHLQRIAGTSEQTAVGDSWANAIHPDDRERFVLSWGKAVSAGKTYQASGRFLHSDGSLIWFDVVADRIESDGELIGFVGAVEDVSERVLASEDIKQSNNKLREALEQLQLAQEQAIKRERLGALGQMAAGVAHDINNSLAPLLTYSELLAKQRDVQGQSREWVELIRLGVSDTAGIVKRLDHFYRESHNREFLDSIQLSEIVSQAVELTRPKWKNSARSEGKVIDVRVEAESNPIINGHASQIRSVLTNLIFNAVDAIEDRGTIAIGIAESSGQAILRVDDDGSGMTSEQLNRCLEPFYSSKTSGSGLGLSECHGVIRQHGGSIDIDSQPGLGTKVRIELPAAVRPDRVARPVGGDGSDAAVEPCREDVPSRPASIDSVVGEPLVGDSANHGILYIDDDPIVRRSTVALLKSLGIDVDTAADGPSGLQRLEESEFDLVMCDQGMPGMDGIAVLNAIKQRWPHVPVVMVSGWSLPAIGDGAQPDGFLEKPFALDELLSLLQQHLQLADTF